MASPYNQGWDAYDMGKFTSDNPYEIGTKAYDEWRNGWDDAAYEDDDSWDDDEDDEYY